MSKSLTKVDRAIIEAYNDLACSYPAKTVADRFGVDANWVSGRAASLRTAGYNIRRRRRSYTPHQWTTEEDKVLFETVREFDDEPYMAFYEMTGIRPSCAYARLTSLKRSGVITFDVPTPTGNEYELSDMMVTSFEEPDMRPKPVREPEPPAELEESELSSITDIDSLIEDVSKAIYAIEALGYDYAKAILSVRSALTLSAADIAAVNTDNTIDNITR